ncbi:3-phosphoinositide-dependent protein kinase 1 [Auxenochlorella protothecoides]|uniref:non-specific serine/threonine protein kinase n=1 Tax=Auxenochlorella protothecoides TaxID=3075 RepID=A0A087SNB5_AUXPR|nr:3-phosphoinositide-dependent protein kinase 1 [Auxenochlorella protothecoides]KFM27219.1 3-phosphoinositide-dependent protein kinase 1 [Auxenochlorella protothecoides]
MQACCHPAHPAGYPLEGLWKAYEAWSAYGAEVPLTLNVSGGRQEVVQSYVPYLSGIQVFRASPAPDASVGSSGDSVASGDLSPDSDCDEAAAYNLSDFELLRRLGDGSYSQVVLARPKAGGKEVALKIMDKRYLIRHSMVEYIRRERAIMDQLSHPGVARLYFTFQDAYSLYMGIEHCPNGELYDQVRLKRALGEDTARAYAAEVVDVLAHLRARGVVHRDLKPENLLLTAEGHLKLIDFGSAKALPGGAVAASGALFAARESGESGRGTPARSVAATPSAGSLATSSSGRLPDLAGGSAQRLVSLVGTADYVSPEVLGNRAVTPAADLWALGCVLYQMLVGRPPFKSPSEYLTFQKVISLEYEIPEHLSPEAQDLIRSLLRSEPEERLGAQDLQELRRHPFFRGIDWDTLWTQHGPSFAELDLESMGSVSSSFDWELQSLSAALPGPGSYADVPRAHGSDSGCESSDDDFTRPLH